MTDTTAGSDPLRRRLGELIARMRVVLAQSSIGADNLNYALRGLSLAEGNDILDALLQADAPPPLQAIPVEWAEAANSARGLCESEARKWETHSPKTAEHWHSVATRLGALYLTQDHLGQADAGIGPALSEPVPIPEPVTRASEIVDWLRQGDCIWPNDRERAIAILTGKFAAEETTSAIGKQLAALPVQAPRGPQEALLHPVSQVYFRAGLIACREYMARFVEAQDPAIANSIRANWWPRLGQDFGPPRKLDFAEVTSGEYGTPEFRCKTADEVSPTQEALPIALGFLAPPDADPPVQAHRVTPPRLRGET